MVEDLAQPESIARIVQEIQGMIKRGIPLRFGMVPVVKDENSTCRFLIDKGLVKHQLIS